MTTGDQNPNPLGQPSGFPPPANPYNQPPPAGYPPPPAQGYPPPPPPGYQPTANPYDAPGGYYQGAPAPSGQPGGLGVRFGARVIDGLLVGIVAGVLAMAFGVSDSILVTGLFSGLLMFAYFVGMEVSQGRTVGKMLLNLSVHGPQGAAKPDFKQSAIRNSFTLLPIVPYVGGLLAVIAYVVIAVTINNSPSKQGKHDELAGGTQVVKG